MPRWLAVGLGCLTALGMQTVVAGLLTRTTALATPLIGFAALFVALVLGGYVTGHFVARGRATLLYGAFVAIVYILLTATAQATRDAIVAREAGLAALPPIDFVQLTLEDILALAGATCGAWLAMRLA